MDNSTLSSLRAWAFKYRGGIWTALALTLVFTVGWLPVWGFSCFMLAVWGVAAFFLARNRAKS